ncbi:hypothetical protein AURDEDRAFT_160683 [Auricularia subglabra TFB-10046 SS5]|nr:hypothetical protein AURDEDRAFT_160683 [Auricularia subglabra TFB-10046 SS5]
MESAPQPSTSQTSHQGKIEDFKKRRGPVSCAECRRLKLKCDRRVPCSSCTKRGCAPICPNGTLTAGPGNRFVLADTQKLHEKIEQMSKRISVLEDALAFLQSQLSGERHPLLSDELMLIKAPLVTHSVDAAINDIPDIVADAMGTLTLGDREQFYGPYAAADYLTGDDSYSCTPGTESALPPDMHLHAGRFPFGSPDSEIRDRVSAYLPLRDEALVLVDLYFANVTWSFLVISRQEVDAEILSSVYKGDLPDATAIHAHDLSVLLMIFAFACLVDLGRPPSGPDAANYYTLARTALGINSVLEHPTLSAIRAIHMMTWFLYMFDTEDAATMCFVLSGLNSQLCQTLGLHRDDSRWSLGSEEVQKRRMVFWEVLSLDTWASIASGRPACFTPSQVDAKLPADIEKYQMADGTWQASFRALTHAFEQDCLLKIVNDAFGVAHLTYASVLKYDRLVREHPFNQCLRQASVGSTEPEASTAFRLQRTTAFCLGQKVLLTLHHTFFVQALNDTPADPLKSRYGQSVLAVFQCSFNITASVRALLSQLPLALRFWSFVSWCFSASVFLSSLVVRSPGCGLGQASWVELERVRQLFEQLASDSPRMSRLLVCHQYSTS